MLAIKGGQLEVVKTLVEKERLDVNVVDEVRERFFIIKLLIFGISH